MLLAIDTATKWTGLALYDGRGILAESGWYSHQTQTVELAPAVAQMLLRAGVTTSELSAAAVAIGPGSYTGLRIGLGFAKGLALANPIKLIGIPTLDIVAAAVAENPGKLIVVAEAGRTRVCAGTYRWRSGKGWQAAGQPVIVSWEEVLAQLDEPAIFAGEIDPNAAKLIRNWSRDFRVLSAASMVRRAGFLAELGWQRLRRGWTDDPAALAPIYLRDPSGAAVAQEEQAKS